MMTRTVVAFEARTPVVLNAAASTEVQMLRAEAAAATAVSSAASASTDAATASGAAGTASTDAASAATSAATATTQASAATTAKTGAETARDEAAVARSIYGTEALGRAAVADAAYFLCYGSTAQNAIEYRQRTNSTTSVLIRAYPSLSAMLDTWSRLSIFRNTAYVSASTEWALLPDMYVSHSGFSGTGSISGTTLTITGTPTGKLAVGSPISGGTIAAGTRITALGTGTGGAGTYTVNTSQTVSSTTVTGGTPRLFVQWFVRDTSGTRLIFKIALDDGTVVMGVTTSAANIDPTTFAAAGGGTGKRVMPLVVTTAGTTAGFQSGGTVTIDFGTGANFGTASANAFADTELVIEKLSGAPGVSSQVTALIAADSNVLYNNAIVRPLVTMPTSATSTTGRGALACTRITIDPAYPLGSANVMLWECGRRSSDSFFRAQIGTYDGTSTTTILAATNNNYVTNATGYTGLVTFDLKAQAGNTLGITAGTIIGEIEIDFGTGASFGSYATKLTWAEGALIKSRIQMGAATQGVINTLAGAVVTANAVRRSPYPLALQGSYLDLITDDLIIENGVPGRAYCVNVRSDTAGSTRRLHITLYDTVRGANVAYWSRQETYDFASTLPESICLAGASLGGPISGGGFGIEYTGTSATLFLNKANVRFDQGVSSYTTSASAVNVNRIWSPEETERRILEGRGHRNKLRTFGPGGDFASLKLAVDSLFSTSVLSAASGNADNIQRAWWPFSDLCTPAHQWTLQAMPGHSEVKPAVIPSGVGFARGILCWMGMTIRLLDDTEIKGETTGGTDTYAIDYNLGGRIIAETGALVWADSGVAVHQDAANALSIPSVANAADKTAGQQFFRIIGLIEGGRYKSDLQAWSCGTSDGCRIIFRRTVLETTGIGANWATHTSPSNVAPGYYEFDDVTLVGGTKSISLTTSNTVAARHGIRVTNSDVTSVSSGGAGYVRIGKQPGVTYSASLEP